MKYPVVNPRFIKTGPCNSVVESHKYARAYLSEIVDNNKIVLNSSKRKSKSKIQVLSNEEVSTIEKMGIDLGAGLSKKELAAIKKAGIDLRADGEKFWKSPQGISIKASAEGKPDPNAVRINVFDEAKKVKNFSQLERFIEK